MFDKTMVRDSIPAALRMWGASLVLLGVVASHVHGQTLTVLASFDGINGSGCYAGLTLGGNTLYGTTNEGGPAGFGTVFSLPVSGGSPTVLASFNFINGEMPFAGLTLSGNTLYGTTYGGGANGCGTVFSVPVSGGSATVLASFNRSNGEWPFAGLTLSGNTLYGTTYGGGANGCGTVFSVPVSGGSAAVLASFNGSNGDSPYGGLTQIGNTLYGMTEQGGDSGYGTVFSIPVSGGSLTALASFNGSNGDSPYGGLTQIGNTLYGTTNGGGANGYGTVFSLPVSGGSLTVLASFNGSNGDSPYGGLTQIGNTLYGTTNEGGPGGFGTVFSLPVSGGSLTALASFNGSNGENPVAGLTLKGKTLFGTTTRGGDNGFGTVFALNMEPGTIALSNAQNATIITGGTGTVGMTVSNSPSSGYNLNYTLAAAVASGSATLGTMTSGTGSLAPSASQSCTVAATSTNLGNNNISLTASDPNSSNLSLTATATLTVLGHAAPSLAVSAGNNLPVIAGATVGLSLSNGPQGQTGLASLDVNSLGPNVTGSTGGALVASGSSQSYAGKVNSGAFGPQTQTFSLNAGDDHTLPGASAATDISTTAALTVYDHSNASLSSSAAQTTETINFGNVLRGATVPGQSFTLYNLAANTTADYTANLKLAGVSPPTGDAALTTNLSTFNGLPAASGSNGKTFTASLDTGNYTTTGTSAVTLSASQLADDSALPGAGGNNNGALTVTVQANVGNATADAGNSKTAFGAPLTAPVAAGGSYANLESTVKATSGSGGGGMLGSTATILAGTNSGSGSAQTVSMAWRTQTSAEGTRLVSDVLDLSGMGLNGMSGQTSPFVLQMDYDPGSVGGDEAAMAAEEMIQPVWLDPATNQWENATDGNFGTNSDQFYLGAWPPGDLTLGDWGVNTANHTVWAVLDHNSVLAVVPEPSTLVLLGIGGAGLLARAWRRRSKARLAAEKTDPGEDGSPATLSFPSQEAHRFCAVRRAA